MALNQKPQPLLRILLIEDSKLDALLIEKELNAAIPEGYDLKKAITLEEAINLLPNHRFDVALLDRTLPDADNFDGLYSLQNMAPELPIVFLTSYQNEQTALESIQQGAQDYLLKGKSNGLVIKRAIQFAILRKEFEGILIQRANFDFLTGLANRSFFESRLDIALSKLKRYKTVFAMLFLDLDLFKTINDTYGHATGDLVLKEVGTRLKQLLRPYDTAARFGGDEFAVLLECIDEVKEIEDIATRIIASFKKPIQVFGHELTIDVSIGIAIGENHQNISAEKLKQQADDAMYRAKTKPGSCYCLSNCEAIKRLN